MVIMRTNPILPKMPVNNPVNNFLLSQKKLIPDSKRVVHNFSKLLANIV